MGARGAERLSVPTPSSAAVPKKEGAQKRPQPRWGRYHPLSWGVPRRDRQKWRHKSCLPVSNAAAGALPEEGSTPRPPARDRPPIRTGIGNLTRDLAREPDPRRGGT